jgi:NMD protein affecting ribosome stability and mRNA decay
MKITGSLQKMKSKLTHPITYHLPIGEQLVDMNALIGENIHFNFENLIFCVDCGAQTYKSFNQGFCYSCFKNSPMASECIIHPERCQAHLGIGRDMEWERKYHLTPQLVYLALTANAKVGITRKPQIPTRWIDQGAYQTIILAETPNRYLSGMIEVHLKSFISDKTHWQNVEE